MIYFVNPLPHCCRIKKPTRYTAYADDGPGRVKVIDNDNHEAHVKALQKILDAANMQVSNLQQIKILLNNEILTLKAEVNRLRGNQT